MKIKATFAILDVINSAKERETLTKYIEGGGKMNITLAGVLDGVHSRDDGTSREFSITVIGIRHKTNFIRPASSEEEAF